MSETPHVEGEEADVYLPQKPLAENAVLKFVRRPRPLLFLLVAWALIGVLVEVFTASGLFLGSKDHNIDGALAARALDWQGIPLAALYLYCARDPVKFQRVFWLALIEQASAVVSILYHWLVTTDFTFGSILIPLIGSGALGALVFLHLFEPREAPAPAKPAPAG